jgi:predicted DNA-binding transcriptional regulator YafY
LGICLVCSNDRQYLPAKDQYWAKPLHASQQTQETEDGLLTEIECYLTPELEMMILSHGEKVKVLAPDVLASRIDERIRAMTYLYTKNDDHVGES